MSKEASNAGNRTGVPDQTMDDCITERRKRLAHLLGRLLARTWLKQRRQTGNGKPSSGDSQNDRGA